MKFIHLSDLHLGKRVNEMSMLEDQRYILNQIVDIIEEEKPDVVLIAGDVYDKSVASTEAITLFDSFLCRIVKQDCHVCIIPGNHDSPERMAFGARLMEQSKVHIAPVYDGTITKVSLEDEYGAVDIHLLPFVKPAHVRRYYAEEEILTYTDAIRVVIHHTELDDGKRNVLVTHQFVTGATRSDSEEVSVGGSDNVDVQVFSEFDYVALGHIHGAQNIGSERVRYCGTPLKYSLSEVNHKKSVTVVALQEKEELEVRTIPLHPKRDMRKLRGTYRELMTKEAYEGTDTNDYVGVVLTDEEHVPDAIAKMRLVYPNLMKLEYDNQRTQRAMQLEAVTEVEKKSALELFMEFYEQQNNQSMNAEQIAFTKELIERIEEGER